MKKFNFILMTAIAVTFTVTACNSSNPSGDSSKDSTVTSRDSSGVLPPPSDNSSATNPSMADTAYSKKDTSNMNRDSSIKH